MQLITAIVALVAIFPVFSAGSDNGHMFDLGKRGGDLNIGTNFAKGDIECAIKCRERYGYQTAGYYRCLRDRCA
ncbi:hypothetical protein F5Y18DRAFT_404776 [Xylariaceae sp. FL1019]|nr:hypothetical protein F5Y18DRAFT_404776 [Xylariaceae sp. FL1019]